MKVFDILLAELRYNVEHQVEEEEEELFSAARDLLSGAQYRRDHETCGGGRAAGRQGHGCGQPLKSLRIDDPFALGVSRFVTRPRLFASFSMANTRPRFIIKDKLHLKLPLILQ